MKHKIFRTVALMLSLVILLFTVTGCGDDNANGSDSDSNMGNYDMIITSPDKINCDYLLVYHDTASFSEKDAFVDLLEQLSLNSTASFQICPDTLNVPKANQKIILLGSTKYTESKASDSIIKDIRSNNYYDYLLRTYNNRISINWVSKYGRDAAFEYLMKEILPNGLDNHFNQDFSYLYLSDRSDSPLITIDDVNIVQYSVVIPTAASYMERYSAHMLVDAIKETTGIELPIVNDIVEESTYEILIGDTNRGETYVTSFFATSRFTVAQYGSKLILRGGQVEATSQAARIFSDMVTHSGITAKPLHIKANYCKTGNVDDFSTTSLDGYKLVYADEFNSSTINDNIWTVAKTEMVSFTENPHIMYYRPNTVTLTGSDLNIRTYLSELGYTSGMISSERGFTFKHGYIETKAKFRTTEGYWVKLMLTNMELADKTVSQIDVFNSLGSKDSIFTSAGILEKKSYNQGYLNLFDEGYEGYRTGKLPYEQLLNDNEYHTYGVEWTEEYLKFFIDGIAYGTVEITDKKFQGLNTEMYLQFFLGVEMTNQAVDDELAEWPIDFSVDWVRIYQKDGAVFNNLTKTK